MINCIGGNPQIHTIIVKLLHLRPSNMVLVKVGMVLGAQIQLNGAWDPTVLANYELD